MSGARHRIRGDPIVSPDRATPDTITPARAPDRARESVGFRLRVGAGSRSSAASRSPGPVHARHAGTHSVGSVRVPSLRQSGPVPVRVLEARSASAQGLVGSFGCRPGGAASPDRVSLGAGLGRSCAQAVGRHTPLQVSLNGKPDRPGDVRPTTLADLDALSPQVPPRGTCKGVCPLTTPTHDALTRPPTRHDLAGRTSPPTAGPLHTTPPRGHLQARSSLRTTTPPRSHRRAPRPPAS